MTEDQEHPNKRVPTDQKKPGCSCVSDPFANLPPELRPKGQPDSSSLRKVTCPGCGKVYWTNRKVDICFECEEKAAAMAGG
jgi:hypothetical protein